jgi:hypothetical protein
MSDTTDTTPTTAPVASAPQPTQQALPLAAKAAPAVDVPGEVARIRAELDAERAALRAEKAAASAEVTRVRAEADARILRVETTAAFRGLGFDEARTAAALKLMGDQLAVVDGLVVSRADPKVPAGDVIKAWVEGDGAILRPPTVPAGGSGAPSSTSMPAAAKATDLSTPEGATAYANALLARGVAAVLPSRGG